MAGIGAWEEHPLSSVTSSPSRHWWPLATTPLTNHCLFTNLKEKGAISVLVISPTYTWNQDRHETSSVQAHHTPWEVFHYTINSMKLCLPWVFWWNIQGHLRLSKTGIKHIKSDCLVAFLFKRWVKMSFGIFLGLITFISDGPVTQWHCSQKAWRCTVQSDSPWACGSI